MCSVGFTEAQAEAQAQVFTEVISDELASKRDLKELELALKRELKELELATSRGIKGLELRLTLRLGALIVAAVGTVAAIVKSFG